MKELAIIFATGAVCSAPFLIPVWAIGKLYGITVKDESGLVYHFRQTLPVCPETLLENTVAGIGSMGWVMLLGPFAAIPSACLLVGATIGGITHPFEKIYRWFHSSQRRNT